jgi:hypothetical protein
MYIWEVRYVATCDPHIFTGTIRVGGNNKKNAEINAINIIKFKSSFKKIEIKSIIKLNGGVNCGR